MRHKLLIVEDEPELRALLREELSHTYDVIDAENLARATELARTRQPDIALLDVRLPDGSGIDLCRDLRNHPLTSRTQVIMLTGQGETDTVVRAFDNGADDFVTKPFNMKELKARISSKKLRVEEGKSKSKLRGNMELVADQLVVRIEQEELRLSSLEFSLLQFLLENDEKIVSRKQILKRVWPDTVVSDRTVDAHIVSLRKKLVNFDHEIVTIYGAGYAVKPKKVPSSS